MSHNYLIFLILCAISAQGNANTRVATDLPDASETTSPFTLSSSCSPMRAAAGNIVRVNSNQVSQLQKIINSARAGDTILFEDGEYDLNGVTIWISTPGITLRSASGDPDAVILDGNYRSEEIVTIAASNVTIAELTLKNAFTHIIHIVSGDYGDTLNTHLYRLKLFDPREQAVKINPRRQGSFVDKGTIACSLITLTEAGRAKVNPSLTGCYTGGIDAHQARGWSVRDNIIDGFWCHTGLSQHAIHFWRGGRDNIIERNKLTNNARGIGFGLMAKGPARIYGDNYCVNTDATYIGHYGGIIRNNTIYVSSTGLLDSPDGFDCGVCLASACKANVVHNTIVSTGNNFSSIEWRYGGSSDIQIINNLASHRLRERDGASASLSGNLQNADLDLFVDALAGDLHLSPGARSAIDRGTPLTPGLCDFDFENDVRGLSPDIGADEI